MKTCKKGIMPLAVVVAATMMSIGVPAQTNRSERPLATVASVDLKRYSGRWYEIARYPNRFQKQCAGNVTAAYRIKDNGRIEVTNECIRRDGRLETAVGEAKVADKATNARLKVRFAPPALSWLPFVWGDYWIVDLGKNYEYAVIGDPDREHFWILSREPQMSDARYQELLRRAEAMGFDPRKVQRTSQNVEVLKGAAIPKSE
ncbi:MAG: lipocalin family protein [Pyrinomonadaceae bacterium]